MTDSIAFVIHPHNPFAQICADRMASWFINAGLRVVYPQRQEPFPTGLAVVTFGGDGTLLAGAEYALQSDAPLMGINLGTTGFLTEGDPEQMESMFRAIMEKKYYLEERSLLKIDAPGLAKPLLALNDAVVTRGGFARLIQVETMINGEEGGSYIADGVIVATPTGSTGYSLSAGGPVVAPGVECMIISPVCAHSLQHCPYVVPHGAKVVFRLNPERNQQAQLQVDGRSVMTLSSGDYIHVTGAEQKLKLVRTGDYRFFHVLKTKLSEWSSLRKDEMK